MLCCNRAKANARALLHEAWFNLLILGSALFSLGDLLLTFHNASPYYPSRFTRITGSLSVRFAHESDHHIGLVRVRRSLHVRKLQHIFIDVLSYFIAISSRRVPLLLTSWDLTKAPPLSKCILNSDE